jgi:hypothetical protein
MGLTLLNNIAALQAENAIQVNSKNLQTTLFQLSTGSRINTGADDPAGLSIANELQASIAACSNQAPTRPATCKSQETPPAQLHQGCYRHERFFHSGRRSL